MLIKNEIHCPLVQMAFPVSSSYRIILFNIVQNNCSLIVIVFCFVFSHVFLSYDACCVYVLKVASIGGLMPFLVACHCTIFIVNLLFCYVLGK